MLRSALAAAFLLVGHAAAHAAEVTQSVNIAAPPARVWRLIGPFEAISAWLPGAASSPADQGSTVGSVRVITLNAPGHPKVVERLTDRTDHSYSYVITDVDPHVLPVAGYSSTISVAAAGTGSTVTWHGSFVPRGASESAADQAVTKLYRAGLDNIRAMAQR